jgi:predicted protein tyrosine phosphatase
MKYNIRIMSKDEAIHFNNTYNDYEQYQMISIIDTGEEIDFKTNPSVSLLKVYFDDITPNGIKLSSKCKLMSQSQAEIIKETIDKCIKEDITNIIIHCTAGISRSGAIGCILARYLNGDDIYLFHTGKYLPNEYVYELMCKTFGLIFSQEEFKKRLKISSKKCHEDLKGYGDFGINLDDMFGGNKHEKY